MTDKDLKKLKRQDLLEILVSQEKEINRLQSEAEKMNERLQEKYIVLEEAGSIAEAALRLNGVFESAQAAAVQYMDSVRNLSSRQEAICAKRDEESRRAAEQLQEETEKRCQEMERQTKKRCAQMLADAEQQVQERWKMLHQKLDEFFESRDSLKELLHFVQNTSNGGQ